MSKYRLLGYLKKILIILLSILIFLIWIVPIIWLIYGSFLPSDSIARSDFGFALTLDNYREVFERTQVLKFLKNSVIVGFTATFLSALIGIPAAYSMARWNTGGSGLAFWILSSRMMPPAVSIIPFFLLFSKIGIVDTIFGLIIVHLTFGLAFVIWMSRVFIYEVPVEIEEAARVDGANLWTIISKITLPLARPGLIATMILNLIFSWNEYLFAFSLSLTEKSRTLPIVAGIFVTSYQIKWGPMFAAACIIMIPILVLALLVQRHIIGGLTMGAFK